MLKENGYLFFTLPDKRYSFDIFRNNTEISHLINDYYYPTSTNKLHNIESEIFYNYTYGKSNNDLAKNRFINKKYKKEYDNLDLRFDQDIHPGVHRHVFDKEMFIDKIILPMLYLYFDNFKLISCDYIENTGEFYTILQKKNNCEILFPEKLFL